MTKRELFAIVAVCWLPPVVRPLSLWPLRAFIVRRPDFDMSQTNMTSTAFHVCMSEFCAWAFGPMMTTLPSIPLYSNLMSLFSYLASVSSSCAAPFIPAPPNPIPGALCRCPLSGAL